MPSSAFGRSPVQNWQKFPAGITIPVMNPVLYHNPRCSKSRATLALLQERGIDPDIVLYLDEAPTRETLRQLVTLLGLTPRQLIRTGEEEYAEQGIDNPELSDDQLIEALHRFPILMQRPILVVNDKARIGRPPESVIEIV